MALMVPKAVSFSLLTVMRGRGLGEVGDGVLLTPHQLGLEQQEEPAWRAQ